MVNLAIYQAAWFICVLGENSLLWLALLLVGLHFVLSPRRKSDLYLVLVVVPAGVAIDATLKALGLFNFSATGFPIPWWLIVIWLTLATLPNHSLAWMQHRLLLSSALAAIGGPAAYLAGERLGVATLNWDLHLSLGVLALVWALFWPLVMYLAGRLATSERVPTAS
jgi:hypothetical protein